MTSSHILLDDLLHAKEGEHLEFKEAKNQFDFEKLVKYCVAMANEGGGKIVLGVTDRRPRQVVGTSAFENLERIKADLDERLRIRIDIDEITDPGGRVLIVKVPPRPIGVPIQFKGAYWMRGGEDLMPMTSDMLKRIFDESDPDFSAEICPKAVLNDLDDVALNKFRTAWKRKSGNDKLDQLSNEQLLVDAELIFDGGLTYAALILFGTHQALGKHLPQAEVVFEYRSSEVTGSPQERLDVREGLFLFEDKLAQKINLRNDKQHFQSGLFIWDIPTFNEAVIREAVLNAVCHRDYRLGGSVFIHQYPRKLVITSPGGFPPGITLENILRQQSPRNRRIAEALAKSGLVERSGQGVNRMFEECIRESKALPDFSGTDNYHVVLTINGEIQDIQFLQFLEKVGNERLSLFTTQDMLVLDLVHKEQKIPDEIKDRLIGLVEHGVIERTGRAKYILSKRFYSFIGKKGTYTRKRGLDRETNKELILKHIHDNKKEGSPLRELMQVLPSFSKHQVQSLLRELKEEKKIRVQGKTNAGRWYPFPLNQDIASKKI